MLNQLHLKSDHGALEAINRLEAAIFSLKEKYTEQNGNKSPVRTAWPFVKDPMAEKDKLKLLSDRAELLLQLLKSKYPNHPQTFLDVSKIQDGKVLVLVLFAFITCRRVNRSNSCDYVLFRLVAFASCLNKNVVLVLFSYLD